MAPSSRRSRTSGARSLNTCGTTTTPVATPPSTTGPRLTMKPRRRRTGVPAKPWEDPGAAATKAAQVFAMAMRTGQFQGGC